MKHIARKRFGQHFLTDGGIIDAIVDAIGPQAGQPMVEIGPGLAALTQPLVERLGHLTVVELDRDLAARLRAHSQLTVVESDVLRVDFTALAAQVVCELERRGQAVVLHADIVFVLVQTPHHPDYEGTQRLPEARVDFDYRFLVQAAAQVSAAATRHQKRVCYAEGEGGKATS